MSLDFVFTDLLERHDEVAVKGVGAFSIRIFTPYVGTVRNKTSAKRLPFFKAAAVLTSRVNGEAGRKVVAESAWGEEPNVARLDTDHPVADAMARAAERALASDFAGACAGIGTFFVKRKSARSRRGQDMSETAIVPAHRILVFMASDVLKARVNHTPVPALLDLPPGQLAKASHRTPDEPLAAITKACGESRLDQSSLEQALELLQRIGGDERHVAALPK